MKTTTLLFFSLSLVSALFASAVFAPSAGGVMPAVVPPFEPGKRLGPYSLGETSDEIRRRGVSFERREVDAPGVLHSGPYRLTFDPQTRLVEIRVQLDEIKTGFFFDGKRIEPGAKRFEIVARLKNCKEDGPTFGSHTVRCDGANVIVAGPRQIVYLVVRPLP